MEEVRIKVNVTFEAEEEAHKLEYCSHCNDMIFARAWEMIVAVGKSRDVFMIICDSCFDHYKEEFNALLNR